MPWCGFLKSPKEPFRRFAGLGLKKIKADITMVVEPKVNWALFKWCVVVEGALGFEG